MENTLELKVINSSVGVLETSIDTLELYVNEKLQEYNPENYLGDADSAKKDRAELNKAKKQIGDARKKIIAEMMKPYVDFENRCKVLEKNIDTASGKLDEIVKLKENEEKEAKKKIIEVTWESKGFELFSVDKVFNPKWLNKTYKITDIQKEIDEIIAKTYKDLKTIERFADDAELLKAMYLENLDIEEVFSKADELQRNRELLAKESESRDEREKAEHIAESKSDLEERKKDQKKSNLMAGLVADALETEVKAPKQKEFVMTFKATEDEKLRLETWLLDNGFYYEPIREIEF